MKTWQVIWLLLVAVTLLFLGMAMDDGNWTAVGEGCVVLLAVAAHVHYRTKIEKLVERIPIALGKASTALGDRCTYIFNAHDTGPVEQCVHANDHLDNGLPHLREDGHTYMPPFDARGREQYP